MVTGDSVPQNRSSDIRMLGTFWIIYGIARLIAALWLISFTNTATVMFGALLNRVPDPFTMMNFFHIFYIFLIVLSAVCGVFGILAGVALLASRKSGRMLGLIAGFLSLSDIPLGLTLGIYSLIFLLPLPSKRLPD